jgi:hypothetical protein
VDLPWQCGCPLAPSISSGTVLCSWDAMTCTFQQHAEVGGVTLAWLAEYDREPSAHLCSFCFFPQGAMTSKGPPLPLQEPRLQELHFFHSAQTSGSFPIKRSCVWGWMCTHLPVPLPHTNMCIWTCLPSSLTLV